MSVTEERVAGRYEKPEPKRRNRQLDFTDRDAAAIRWLAEQYGATYDVLSVLLGRLGRNAGPLSLRSTRDQVERWIRQDLVRKERALGQTWVTPTRWGYRRAELDDLPGWAVPVTRVRHCHAVNVVRLSYETTHPYPSNEWPWTSERLTYKERGKGARWHIPDGVIRDPQPPMNAPAAQIAVEVELTHKSRRTLAEEVFLNLRAGVEAVVYYVETEEFAKRLRADIAAVQRQTGTNKRYSVNLLPEVPGVEYIRSDR